MKKYDFLSSLAWLVMAILFLKGSISLGLGSFSDPGPGLFPLIISCSLITFSSGLIISSLTKRGGLNFTLGDRFWPELDGIKRISLSLIALIVYALIMTRLGFVITTFFFMIFLLRFIEPQKWFTIFFTASITSFLAYVIFGFWLQTQLPVGPLGF